jgi:hypothetical protein
MAKRAILSLLFLASLVLLSFARADEFDIDDRGWLRPIH